MGHVLHGSQLRRSFIAIYEDSGGDIARRLGRADLLVTAMQLDGIDVTTLVRPCQSIRSCLQVGRLEGSRSEHRNCLAETNCLPSLQYRESSVYQIDSISRCALLNAPAGSFSKDIDEVEVNRVIVARYALVRFGEENDDRYC